MTPLILSVNVECKFDFFVNTIIDKRRDASVKVGEDWTVIKEIEFSQLAILRMNDLPEAEDLYQCGSVETYDTQYDRVTPKVTRIEEISKVNSKLFRLD